MAARNLSRSLFFIHVELTPLGIALRRYTKMQTAARSVRSCACLPRGGTPSTAGRTAPRMPLLGTGGAYRAAAGAFVGPHKSTLPRIGRDSPRSTVIVSSAAASEAMAGLMTVLTDGAGLAQPVVRHNLINLPIQHGLLWHLLPSHSIFTRAHLPRVPHFQCTFEHLHALVAVLLTL